MYELIAKVTKADGSETELAERFNSDVAAFVKEVRLTFPTARKIQVFKGSSANPSALVWEE